MSKKRASLVFAALVGAAGAAQAQSVAPPETREERFHVNGRFQYDVAATDADCANAACTGANESGIRSYARRVFLGVDGRLSERWRYDVKLDFAVGGSVRADDLFLEYAGEDWSLLVGNHNAASPLEDRVSSLNIPFNERSFLISAGGFGKRPGIGWVTNGDAWSLGAALQSNDPLDTGDSANNGTEAYFAIARATWAPIYAQAPEGMSLLHLGATVRYRDTGADAGFSGLLTYNPSGLSTRQGNNARAGAFENDIYLGAEFAAQWNAFGVGAEYGQFASSDSTLNTVQNGDADATGYYIDAFWSPTGESRRYKPSDGSFGAVTPIRTLGSDGGVGHIMLSGRYESLDMTDANFGANGNELTASTLGVSWVPIAYVKFQLNYSTTEVNYVTPDVPGTRVDNAIAAVTLRSQVDW